MTDQVCITTFENEMMAHFWAGVLEQEGIPSVVKPTMGGYGIFGHISFLPHSLYVMARDEERALALLDEAEQGEPEPEH